MNTRLESLAAARRVSPWFTGAALLALLPLAGCLEPQAREPREPPGVVTAEAPELPPDLPESAGETDGLTPATGQRPARYQRIRGPGDIPPAPPPAPVFTPQPPPPAGGGQSSAPPTIQPPGMREVFPHIRLDAAAKVVEFDGAIAWDVHDPQTPMTFLEVVACTPDTKEYESLVVSRARPSNVHAALLLLGIEPGKPGSFTWKDEKVVPIDPQGPPLSIDFVLNAGTATETIINPLTWIVNAANNEPFTKLQPAAAQGPGWLFAGSRIVRRDLGQGEQDLYLADLDGTLVGLTTFGSETIAWGRTISPDASVTEPEWIANVAAMPRVGTPVVVRIRPATAQQPAAQPATEPAPTK